MHFTVTDPPGQILNLDTVTSLADLKTALALVSDAAAIVTLDGIQYLAVKGNAKITLKRDGVEIPIITAGSETVGASGKINPANEFILYAGKESGGYRFPSSASLTDIYLKQYTFERFEEFKNKVRANKKVLLTVGIIVFLIYAVIRQVSYRLENDRGVRTDREIARVEEKIVSIMELAQLNKPLAREELEREKNNLLKFDGNQKKIAAAVAKIDAKINEVLDINTATGEIFYDFSLTKEGVTGGPAYYLAGKLTMLDKNSGTILAVDAKNKSGKVIATDEKFKDGSFLSDRYIFTSRGIYDDKKNLVIKKSDKWQEIVGMNYYGGNIYLLDEKANQIWKYLGGVGEAKNYLSAETKVDFSNAMMMNINGSIYVTTEDKVLKFTSGKPEVFDLAGLDKPVEKITKIAATDDLQNIYLWDESGRRVVVISEAGQYQSQYIIGESLQVDGLFADETLKKIFLLNGAKVYSINLK